MSTTTNNFDIVLPDGSDTFNPLTFNNNAFTRVDTVMKANQDRGVTTATHTYIDGINTILRAVATCNTFVFVATSDYVSGSLTTVDGTTVSLRYANGTTPASNAFRTNQAVMCYLNGSILNIVSAASAPEIDIDAGKVDYDNASSGLSADNVQDAIDELNADLTNYGTVTVIGNGTCSETISLKDSISNYRFLMFRVGYYDSGFPTYGQTFVPVKGIIISNDLTYAEKIICVDQGTSIVVGLVFSNNTTATVSGSPSMKIVIYGIK